MGIASFEWWLLLPSQVSSYIFMANFWQMLKKALPPKRQGLN